MEFNEDIKQLFKKYNLVFKNQRSLGQYLRLASSKNLTLEEYLEKKFKENQIDLKIEQLLKSKNIDLENRRIYLGHANKAGFNSGNKYQDLVDYFNFKENNLTKEKSEKEEIKILLKSRNMTYEYLPSILSHCVQLKIFCKESKIQSLKNYFEYIDSRENEKIINKNNYKNSILKLIDKYQININWNIALSSARRSGFKSNNYLKDIENYFKYLKSLDEILIKKEKIMQEHSFNLRSWPVILGYARRENLNSGDDIQDVLNYFKIQELNRENKKIIKENIRKKKKELMNKFGLNENSFPSYLGKARKRGFKTDDSLKDVENYFKTLVWCDHCERWEEKEYNDKPFHWLDSRSFIHKWIRQNKDLVNNLMSKIKGFDFLLNSNRISGIYGWSINNIIIYVGESTNILKRAQEHLYTIYNYPEYWYDIINHLDNNILEIKVLEKIENKNGLNSKEFSNLLKNRERNYWIPKLKPDSQKCNGTDSIRPLNERCFKINI